MPLINDFIIGLHGYILITQAEEGDKGTKRGEEAVHGGHEQERWWIVRSRPVTLSRCLACLVQISYSNLKAS